MCRKKEAGGLQALPKISLVDERRMECPKNVAAGVTQFGSSGEFHTGKY